MGIPWRLSRTLFFEILSSSAIVVRELNVYEEMGWADQFRILLLNEHGLDFHEDNLSPVKLFFPKYFITYNSS